MPDRVDLSSSSAADPDLQAARERIRELEQLLRLTRHQAELAGAACDSWREAALVQATARAELSTELHRLKTEAP